MHRVVAALLLVLVVASPVLAAGPYDGVWSVTDSNPTQGVITYYVSIHQNDGGLQTYGFNFLFTTFHIGGGIHRIGAGTLSGNVANGNVFDQSPTLVGTFHVTFTDPTHFTGTSTSPTAGTDS